MKHILLLSLLLLCSCYQVKNFHEIDKGKFYRSAQLTGEEFSKAIEEHGIKTIINLRGANTSADWYKEELAAAQRHNIEHISIGMSAKRLPHKQDLIRLLEVLETAERPILIHCQGGADRTGEASAIYQMLYMGKSETEALKMLTVKYFHIEKKMPAKRYFIRDLWEGVKWAQKEYNPCSGEYKYYDPNESACKTGESSPEEDTESDS